nr:restriction endonuclease subunit S [Faecalibacterium prausnitzii]
MSKLDEMIRELCPDGVEYVKLNSVCDIYDGTHSTPNYTESGVKFASVENIGNLYATRKYISEKDFEKYKIKPRIGDVMMTRIGSVGVCTVVDRNEALAFYVSLALLRPQLDKVQSRFLKYAIESIHGRKELRKRTLINAVPIKINKDDIGKVTIPLPPIEIQSEIVHTLDNYTENVVKLQNQLTAELTARQKQYTFYRNKLLTFSGNEKAKIVKISLGDIGPICMCKRILKSQTNTVEGVPFYKIGTFGKKADAYISKETFDEYRSKYSFPKKGDVLISAAGTIGRTVVYDGKPAYFQDSNIVWIDNNESVVLNSYLRYCYELKPWKVSSGGTIQRLYNDNIAKAIITVPSLDVQNRIVNVLDNFEKICSDLNIGLPAEIEARQKQYEYYRDKLLTFVETGNTILSRAEQSRAEQSRAEQSRAEQSRAEQSRALIKLLQYVFGYAVVSLQDVVKNSCSGGTPKKGVSEYYEDGNIPWLRTQEVVFRDICKTECFITESAVKNSAAKWIPENCVIVAISGATAGRCAINKIPLTTNQHCLNLEVDPEMALYRYVYYCICAKQEELLAKKEGARGDLNSTRILSLQIDLPSIEKQKRIVSILDRFDAICNDLTSGLPAEIEARQKQYEYYRDRLLSFKELN